MQIPKLLFWLLVCQLPALGAGTVSDNLEWYHALRQPPFAPPDWLFGAAWGALYLLLGVTGFLMTKNGLNRQNRDTLILFAAQLAANALWTLVFFGLHAPAAAFFVLALILCLTVWLTLRLWKENRPASWLFMPYTLWLVFAGYLNTAMWLLN